MLLPSDLISKFVKITKDDKKDKTETTVYGTVVESNGAKYVRFDGAEESQLTPVVMTVDAEDGERVSVLLKDHIATVTGNITSPAVRTETVRVVVESVEADNVVVNEMLTAQNAEIEKLKADMIDAGSLKAITAQIEDLEADKLSAEEAEVYFANIDFANIGEAAIEKLFTDSGIISDLIMSDGHVTGKLVGVTIIGDLIEGGTVKADKLVILGTDGLYYKLNTNGVTTTAEQTEYNSLNGKIITAKSITAEKVNVDDLVAFGATIGGFHLTKNSIYSGAKVSVNNTTRGIYQDTDGQIAIGDSSNYLKYYKDTDGSYKLAISAKSILFSGGTDVETALGNLQNGVDNIEVGGRNLIKGTKDFSGFYANTSTTEYILGSDGFTYANFPSVTTTEYRAVSSTYSMLRPEDVMNRQVVLSFELRSDTAWTATGTNLIAGFALCNNNTTTRLKYRTVYFTGDIGTAWTRFEIKATLTEDYFTNGTSSFDDCTRFYAQIYNYSVKHLQIRKVKLEYGNKATDWSPAPEDVDSDIKEAAKTASNFMSYDSTNGLQVGNKSGGAWSGFRSQIKSNAFNILNAAGAVVASYGEKLIELGKNATDAIIKLCGGKGQIEYVTDEDSNTEYIQIYSDRVRVKSSKMSSVYSMYTDNSTRWEKSAVNVSPTKVEIYASECIDPTLVERLEGWHTTSVTISSGNIDVDTPGSVTFNGEGVYDDYGKLMSVDRGSSGIWSYSKWSDGTVDLWGVYSVSELACTTALGSMYRTAIFQPNNFPFTVNNPKLVASYESTGYGAMLWATTSTSTSKPPSYYLIRPVSGTIVTGKIIFHVTGTWV